MDVEKLEKVVEQLLNLLGAEVTSPNFKETPKRVAKMYQHFFRNDREGVKEIMEKVFPSEHDQIVIVKDIECFGMCPHHLLPIVYNVAIGYIPNGKVLGLSKLARLAIALSSFPKLQEDFTKEIADVMEKYLKPQGTMVVVKGVHGCVRCRGVELNSETITSDAREAFKNNVTTRSEFLKLIEDK